MTQVKIYPEWELTKFYADPVVSEIFQLKPQIRRPQSINSLVNMNICTKFHDITSVLHFIARMLQSPAAAS